MNANDDNNRFGRRLMQARLKRKLRMADAAKAARISFTTWMRWENGDTRPSVDMLPIIARIVGKRPEELL